MSRVPAGWGIQTVKDLLPIRYGKSLAANLRVADGKYPVVGSAGVMARTNESLINGPTIIVGRKGNVGAVQLLTEGGWPIDTTYYSEVPVELDPRFVTHQLIALRLVRLDSSTATPSLRRQDFEVQELVVPPLDEQRRIVDILEDHFSRLDAATELLASAERRASAWSRSFVDATLWDDQYPQIQVADLLAEPMRNGHSARAVRDGLAGIRTLTLTAVTRNEFTDDFTKVTSADPDRVKSLWLRSGDLLVQRANTPQLVGTTAMFDGPDDWAIYPDLLIRLRANEQRVLGGYLCAAMRSERAHRQMRSKAKGLAGSMPKIDQAAIGSTTVPVPDMDTQQGLLLQLNEVQSVRERTSQAATAAGSRAQVLRNALLAAAFSGRLTGRTSDMEMVEEMAGV